MKFKNGEEAALWAVHYKVLQTIQNQFSYMDSNRSVKDLIAQAIADGVREGLKEFLHHQYSDEDFERDMQLKP